MSRILLSLILILAPLLSFAQIEPSPVAELNEISEVEFVGLSEAEFNALSLEEQEEYLNAIAPPILGGGETVDGDANCFDYYHFGSVQVQLDGVVGGTVSGVPVHFRGDVINNNPYPLVDGAVYAKIFRKQGDNELTHANGHHLVDQFFVKDNLTLAASSSVPLSFDWQVPSYAISGDYQVAFFFTSAKKFNLLGLSFTDDVVGNIFDFTVAGEQTGTVAFNKNTVRIGSDWKEGDMYYHFAAFPPRFDKNQDIPTTVTLSNTTNAAQIVVLTWKLYNWDVQREENVLDTKTEEVILNAKETRDFTYLDNTREGSIHLLVAEAKYRDNKSIMGMRYVREGVDMLRLNFPSITKYPLTANEEQTIFSCMHNTADSVVPNSKLVLTLTDSNNNLIHTYTYEGAIAGNMMATKDTFTPTKTYQTFTLKAELYNKDALVDSVTMVYDCTKLGGTDCDKEGVSANYVSDLSGKTLTILAMIILGVLIVIGVVWYRGRGQSVEDNNMDDDMAPTGSSSVPLALLLLALVSGIGVPVEVEAKSVPWNAFIGQKLAGTHTLRYNGGYSINPETRGTIRNIGVNIVRNAYVYRNGVLIDEDTIIAVGDTISFTAPVVDTDISWYATGVALDTPYGLWEQDAKVRMPWPWNNLTIMLSVNPSSITYTHTGSTAGLSCNASGSSCEVTSPGVIKTYVNYSDTYAKFYNKNTYNSYPSYIVALVSCTYGRYSGSLNVCGLNSQQTFVLSVPLHQIEFTLNAVSLSNPPTAPTVTHTAPLSPAVDQGYVDVSQTFNISGSVDPDGDSIKYEVDWNNDSVRDACYPTNCLDTISSGGSGDVARNWSVDGVKTFKVRAVDSNGAASAWVDKSINIIQPQSRLLICPDSMSLSIGQSGNLSARYWFDLPVAPDCTTTGYTDVTSSSNWSSSNTARAVVDNDTNKGRVTGVAQGNPDIIATYNFLGATKPVTIVNNPDLTLTATGCDLPLETPLATATCNITLSWTALYATTPYQLKRGVTTIDTVNTPLGSKTVPDPVTIGTYNYSFEEATGVKKTASASAQCPSGSAVHPIDNVCRILPGEPTITITATPKTVRRGDKSNLAIDITSTERLNCLLYSATNPSPYSLLNNVFPPNNPINVETKPLKNTQEVLVKCDVANFTTVTKSVPALIEVEGDIEEI